MTRKRNIITGAFVLAIGVPVALMTGCQSNAQQVDSAGSSEDSTTTKLVQANTGLSGAQLWAQTCAHCHNSRSPASNSDAKWELTVSHMRQQAYLTGEQTRKILNFLKASN